MDYGRTALAWSTEKRPKQKIQSVRSQRYREEAVAWESRPYGQGVICTLSRNSLTHQSRFTISVRSLSAVSWPAVYYFLFGRSANVDSGGDPLPLAMELLRFISFRRHGPFGQGRLLKLKFCASLEPRFVFIPLSLRKDSFSFSLLEDANFACSVALILQATIGGDAALFRVHFLSDRVFRFSVCSQDVGCHSF